MRACQHLLEALDCRHGLVEKDGGFAAPPNDCRLLALADNPAHSPPEAVRMRTRLVRASTTVLPTVLQRAPPSPLLPARAHGEAGPRGARLRSCSPEGGISRAGAMLRSSRLVSAASSRSQARARQTRLDTSTIRAAAKGGGGSGRGHSRSDSHLASLCGETSRLCCSLALLLSPAASSHTAAESLPRRTARLPACSAWRPL